MRKILIAVPNTGLVAPVCFKSIYGLQIPEGVEATIEYFQAYGPALVRNRIANHALDYGFDNVLYIDADQIAPADTLVKLAAIDADVAAGWALMAVGSDWTNVAIYDAAQMAHSFYTTANLPKDQVFVADGVGFAATMIRTEIFKQMEYPYFRYVEYGNRSVLSEDLYLCMAVRKLGGTIRVDTSLKIDHFKNITI